MLVKDRMTRHPIMVSPETLATEAQQIMATNRVRHLPVVGDGKRLLGMITSNSFSIGADLLGSLNVWEISRRLSNVRVKQVMSKRDDVLTCQVDTTVERAARMLNENRKHAMIVLDDDTVVGILSEVDIMNALQEMLGLPMDGVRVTVRMPNQPGEFQKIMTLLGDKEWGVMGIGTYPPKRVEENVYDVVIKLVNTTIEEAKAALEELEGHTVIDIRDVV